MSKTENLLKWINDREEGFTIAKASNEADMPNFNTCTHICNGLVKAGLLTVAKVEKERVFTKTASWNIAKANEVNEARVRAKKTKVKPKPIPTQKPKKEKIEKSKA